MAGVEDYAVSRAASSWFEVSCGRMLVCIGARSNKGRNSDVECNRGAEKGRI